MASEGYFFIADLLGFANMISNLREADYDERIEGWISLVKEATTKAGGTQFQLISDTLFAAAPATSAGLGSLVKLARHLLNEGVPQSYPIRGAITFGTYHWGDLIYGKAVINAHKLEAAQNWVGVSCTPTLPHTPDFLGFDQLVMYQPPKKKGLAMTLAVVDWDVPKPKLLLEYLSEGGLMKDNEGFTWELAEKLNNTTLYALYKVAIRRADKTPTQSWGFLSTELIDALFSNQELWKKPG